MAANNTVHSLSLLFSELPYNNDIVKYLQENYLIFLIVCNEPFPYMCSQKALNHWIPVMMVCRDTVATLCGCTNSSYMHVMDFIYPHRKHVHLINTTIYFPSQEITSYAASIIYAFHPRIIIYASHAYTAVYVFTIIPQKCIIFVEQVVGPGL